MTKGLLIILQLVEAVGTSVTWISLIWSLNTKTLHVESIACGAVPCCNFPWVAPPSVSLHADESEMGYRDHQSRMAVLGKNTIFANFLVKFYDLPFYKRCSWSWVWCWFGWHYIITVLCNVCLTGWMMNVSRMSHWPFRVVLTPHTYRSIVVCLTVRTLELSRSAHRSRAALGKQEGGMEYNGNDQRVANKGNVYATCRLSSLPYDIIVICVTWFRPLGLIIVLRSHEI